MDVNYEHIVDFSLCKECEYFKKREDEHPCDECLRYTTLPHSARPYKFKMSKKALDKVLAELRELRK